MKYLFLALMALVGVSTALAAQEDCVSVSPDVIAWGPTHCPPAEGDIVIENGGIHMAPHGTDGCVRTLIGATDNMNMDVSYVGSLQIAADVTISEQDPRVGGPDGLQIPAWFRMVYSDQAGAVHEFFRAFYIRGSRECNLSPDHERVKKGELCRYVSVNLKTRPSPPAVIHYFEFGGAGARFDASIALKLCVGSDESPAPKVAAASELSWGGVKSLFR